MPRHEECPSEAVGTPAQQDETLDLLTAARSRDPDALERLFARYLPDLSRWASGRLRTIAARQ